MNLKDLKPGEKVYLDWGHKYGKPFGFRDARFAMKMVELGKWEELSSNKWSVRGPNNGLQHGYEARFLVLK